MLKAFYLNKNYLSYFFYYLLIMNTNFVVAVFERLVCISNETFLISYYFENENKRLLFCN